MSIRKLVKEFDIYLKNRESLLERDFKHVADKIELHWGYNEFYPFLDKLLVNDQDRKRNGFPLEVIQEIYKLYEIHNQLFPEMKKSADSNLNHRV